MNPTVHSSTPTPESVGRGFLVVRVSTASGAIPLQGAQVEVRSYPADGTPGRGDVFLSAVTDRDGKTPPFSLPTPARSASQSPGGARPFATYLVDVTREGYTRQSYVDVPVFDGILAVQPAILIPLPENRRTDSRTPDGERFFETAAPEL